MGFFENKHTVALGKIRKDLESRRCFRLCSTTSCSLSQYKAVSPPGRVLCSQDLGSFPPSSEASSHKHWQKQDPGPRRQPVLPLGAVFSFLLANTSNPPWVVQCEVRLLRGGSANTTAPNVIWWGPLPESMFPQPRGKILHRAGEQLFSQEPQSHHVGHHCGSVSFSKDSWQKPTLNCRGFFLIRVRPGSHPPALWRSQAYRQFQELLACCSFSRALMSPLAWCQQK